MDRGQVRVRRPQGDAWLKNNCPPTATCAKANNSLLVVTWDEEDNGENNEYSQARVGTPDPKVLAIDPDTVKRANRRASHPRRHDS